MMTSHKLTKKSYEEFFWIIENELAQVTLVTGTITMTLANIRPSLYRSYCESKMVSKNPS